MNAECKIADLTAQSRVRASMKDKSYKVGLIVNGEGYILSASCQCPRQEWLCSHMAATAIYVNRKGFSKADLPNSWISRPKTATKKCSKIKSMADIFPCNSPEYRAASRAFTDEDRQSSSDLQKSNISCPLTWISSPEPKEIEDPHAPPLVEDLLPLLLKNKEEFFERVEITKEQRLFVRLQKNQRKCQLWGQFRRLTLTGSNFGLVGVSTVTGIVEETTKIIWTCLQERLSRARRSVECAFGILGAKWRFLATELETNVENSEKIVKTACLLYNIIIQEEGLSLDDFQGYGGGPENPKIGPQRMPNRGTFVSMDIRTKFMHYFVSPEGEVPWQRNLIQ
eukprot:gene4068-20245_t